MTDSLSTLRHLIHPLDPDSISLTEIYRCPKGNLWELIDLPGDDRKLVRCTLPGAEATVVSVEEFLALNSAGPNTPRCASCSTAPGRPTPIARQIWGLQLSGAGASAALWAPSAEAVALRLADGETLPMTRSADGWHRTQSPALLPGIRYQFIVDGLAVPDPASRSQPDGPEGRSEAVTLDDYPWQATDWIGRPWTHTVLYELHLGTFSREGTFLGAIAHLDHLVRLGVTMIELMPIATFPGSRNWGYDGVLPFAPDRAYGTPRDLQHLVDACHLKGLSIVLDVVYNHFGPKSVFLDRYAKPFFTDRHHTPWGPAINFDGADAQPVESSTSRTRCSGSSNIASMACASMPSRRSGTTARPTSCSNSARRCGSEPAAGAST